MPEDKCKKTLEDPTSRLIHALNHPQRRLILKGLVQGPASASTLAERFDIPLTNVSYHLGRVLNKECEALEVVEEIPRRGAKETVYRVKASFILDVLDWPAIPEPMRSGLRGLALHDFLEAAIASLKADATPSKNGSPLRKDNGYYLYRPVAVDEDGQREISEAAEEFAEKVAAVETGCAVVNPANLLSLIVGAVSFEAAPLRESNQNK
jgi:DNA-binding transcriptional ArsR family regulator